MLAKFFCKFDNDFDLSSILGRDVRLNSANVNVRKKSVWKKNAYKENEIVRNVKGKNENDVKSSCQLWRLWTIIFS